MSSNFQTRERTHAGDKCCECEQCSKVASVFCGHMQEPTVQRTPVNVNSGETYVYPSALQTHQRTHAGETPCESDVVKL